MKHVAEKKVSDKPIFGQDKIMQHPGFFTNLSMTSSKHGISSHASNKHHTAHLLLFYFLFKLNFNNTFDR